MPARHVVGVTAAAHENRARPGLQVQDRHLRGIKAARDRRNREQYGPTARQQFWPEMIGFALRAGRPGENRRRPTLRGHPLRPVATLLVATMIVSSGPQVAPRGRPSSVGVTAADFRVRELCQPKVQDLHDTARRDLDVRGFQIAVNDALLVRGFEASAICFAMGSASSRGIAPRAIRCGRSSPSTSSITSATVPSDFSRPWICAMFG